jgi:hypothetical protein
VEEGCAALPLDGKALPQKNLFHPEKHSALSEDEPLAAALLPAALTQSTKGNWSQPFPMVEVTGGAPTGIFNRGISIDVNGDGLPDWVMSEMDDDSTGKKSAYLGTYLNTGTGYCVASESSMALTWRTTYTESDILPCSSIPSMTMHDPKEDTRTTNFLTSIGLGEYAPAFAEHKVDYSTLMDLGDSDLEKMGIKALGARKRITKGIREQESTCATCNFGLPFPHHVWQSTDSGYSTVEFCQFQDLNGDGLVDYVCDYEGGDGAANQWSGIYINTGTDWCIAHQHLEPADLRRPDLKWCNETAVGA